MNNLIKNSAAACGLILAVAACSPTKTAEDYELTSQTLLQENKYEEAVIQLKNGIREYNKNVALRELLGEIYLAQGNAPFAEKEIQKAFQLGSEKQSLFPKLLKSIHLQGKFSEVQEVFKSKPRLTDEELAESLLYVALAEHALGNTEASVAYISQANEVTEESIYSHLGSAFAKAYENNNNESLILVEEVITQNPNVAEAYMLKGQLLTADKDYVNAIKAYENYLKLLPYDAQGKMFLVNTLIAAREFVKAEPYVDNILKQFPNSGAVHQFKGLIEYDKENFEGAKNHLEIAIQSGLNTPSNNLFAGIANYKLKNFEQAYNQLLFITSYIPDDHIAWRYLASTQLALGYAEGLSETMSNISYDTELDSALFLQASHDLLESGKKDEAYELLLKGNILDSNNPEFIAKQGLLKLKSGHIEGIEEIEKSLMLNPDSDEIKKILVKVYLSRGLTEKALALANEMIDSKPDNVEGYNLAGLVYIQQKEFEQAKPFFDKAKEILPSNALTYIYYAELAESVADYKLSINYIEKLLEEHPKYPKALLKYYLLHKSYGDVNVALARLAAVAKDYPDEFYYQLLYASVLVKENKPKQVVTLLEPLKAKKGLPSSFWEVLGDSYIQMGRVEGALKAFEKWNEIENSVNSKVKLAMALSVSQQYERSLAILDDLAKEYGDSHLLFLRAKVSLGAKKFDETLRLIKAIELAGSNKVIPLGIEELKIKALIGIGKSKEALTFSRELYAKTPSEKLAQYIAITYTMLGDDEGAINFLEGHLTSFTSDVNSRFKLAAYYAEKAPMKAIEQYQIILKIKPDNFIVLNNLAWLMMENDELDNAYQYAKKALKIAPKNEDIKDTYNQIELKRNKQK